MSNPATKIEILYPEYGNQGGDNGNALYLEACLPKENFVYTSHAATPYFVEHTPSAIIMGGMTEAQQELIISRLMPYKDRLAELADQGVPMLFAGNASELLARKSLILTALKLRLWASSSLRPLAICPSASTMFRWVSLIPAMAKSLLLSLALRCSSHSPREITLTATSLKIRWVLASIKKASWKVSVARTLLPPGLLGHCFRSILISHGGFWIWQARKTLLLLLRKRLLPHIKSMLVRWSIQECTCITKCMSALLICSYIHFVVS